MSIATKVTSTTVTQKLKLSQEELETVLCKYMMKKLGIEMIDDTFDFTVQYGPRGLGIGGADLIITTEKLKKEPGRLLADD